MEIGVFSRTYETKDLWETCRRMTAHGIRHTQFNLSSAGLETLPEEISGENLEQIRALTAEFGITVDALSGTFNMIDPDEDARRRGCAQFAVQCRIAQELGIPVVSLCTGSKNPNSKWAWHDDNLEESAWDDLMRSTETILRYAEDNQVILGVEPETSNIVNTPERARKYLDSVKSPYLKIIMDGANLFRPEEVPHMDEVLREAFALLRDDIVLAHAKDFLCGVLDSSAQDRRGFRHEGNGDHGETDDQEGALRFVAAGKGVMNYPLYARLLEEAGYRGPLILHGLSEEEVPGSRRFLEAFV